MLDILLASTKISGDLNDRIGDIVGDKQHSGAHDAHNLPFNKLREYQANRTNGK